MPAWSINRLIRTPLLLLGVCELLLLSSSLYAASLVYCWAGNNCGGGEGGLELRAAIFAIVLFFALISTGLYNFHQRFYYHEVFVRFLVGFVLGAIALLAIFITIPSIAVSRELISVALIFALLTLLIFRYFFIRSVDENGFRHRTLVYGAGSRANAIADLRRKADRRGFKIIGSVAAPGDKAESTSNGDLIRDKSIDQLAIELDADEIVIAMDDRRGNLPEKALLTCKLRGIDVIDLMEFMERESGKIRIDLVRPGWLIFSQGFDVGQAHRSIKRLVDIVVSVSIFLVTLPLLVLIYLAIKIEDGIGAPVLYAQNRVGYRGDEFRVLKFRSMREDAEADGKAVWAQENDERITRVGYWLRKFRLDELPQVFNVIRNDMSLVGPRPERPEFVEQLTATVPYYMARHATKPGLTGWAQIRYPYGSSEEDAIEKLQYDLYYVKNHSCFLDIIVILQTVEVVLWGKGSR